MSAEIDSAKPKRKMASIMGWEFGKRGLPKEMLNDALVLDSDSSIFDHQVIPEQDALILEQVKRFERKTSFH